MPDDEGHLYKAFGQVKTLVREHPQLDSMLSPRLCDCFEIVGQIR
jgi:hypothetical protein